MSDEHPDRFYTGIIVKRMAWDEDEQAYLTVRTLEETPLGTFTSHDGAHKQVHTVLDLLGDTPPRSSGDRALLRRMAGVPFDGIAAPLCAAPVHCGCREKVGQGLKRLLEEAEG